MKTFICSQIIFDYMNEIKQLVNELQNYKNVKIMRDDFSLYQNDLQRLSSKLIRDIASYSKRNKNNNVSLIAIIRD